MTEAGRKDRPAFLVDLAHQRDDLLARVEGALRSDERVLAAWLEGSFGRGTADAWSDIDLHIVVRDDALTAWLGGRDAWFARLGHPVMVMPSSVSELGDWQGIVFEGPVWLDLAVHPVSTATRDVETPLLFARVDIPTRMADALDDDERQSRLQRDLDFFWAMTPIALKYVGRGRTDRTLTLIDLLGGTFVRLWRLIHDPARRGAGGLHWLHPERDAALIAVMPRFDPTIDPPATLDAVTRLMAEVRGLHAEIARLGVAIPVDAVREIEWFRDDVAGMVASDRGDPAAP